MDSVRYERKGMLGQGLSMASAICVAILPKLVCPACWPAYAGLLGSFGIGFVDYTPYLAPLTLFFFTLATLPLAYKAHRRRGYGPFFVGIAATVVAMGGKFWLGSEPAMYTGLALLVAALIWNMWPVRSVDETHCPACAREVGPD